MNMFRQNTYAFRQNNTFKWRELITSTKGQTKKKYRQYSPGANNGNPDPEGIFDTHIFLKLRVYHLCGAANAGEMPKSKQIYFYGLSGPREAINSAPEIFQVWAEKAMSPREWIPMR